MQFTLSILVLATLSLFTARARAGAGQIVLPLPDTHIAPGAAFNFSYDIRGDYCTSSYAYSVFLVTDAPTSLSPADVFMGGFFFGRFDAPNYPAVPYPKNPAPAQLVMPNFSQPQGGWGAGQSASDKTWQLAVMEEWDGCSEDGNTVSVIHWSIVTFVSLALGLRSSRWPCRWCAAAARLHFSFFRDRANMMLTRALHRLLSGGSSA